MFEVGKRYEFHTLENSDGTYGRVTSWSIVAKIEGPLLRLESGEIINTHSPTFEGAIDEDARREFGARAVAAILIDDGDL